MNNKLKTLYISLFTILCLSSCGNSPTNVSLSEKLPPIFPDYVGVTIPEDIAPMNFNVNRPNCDAVDVTVKGSISGELHVNGDYADFDVEEWHELLKANRGGKLTFTVIAHENDSWTQYRNFTMNISKQALNEWGITYRLIAPSYEIFSQMGIYQRNLSNFDEKALLVNTQVPGMCINCHTANRTNPDDYAFHVRGDHGATYLKHNGKGEWLKAKNADLGGSMVYPYWHPSGKYCAFSTNDTHQMFHAKNNNRVEVYDTHSDIIIYKPETHEILSDTLLRSSKWSENCPVFSPDGKWIYFITALQQQYPKDYQKQHYNLCRIAFDAEKGTIGSKVDTIFNAAKMGKSVTWPRPSYDGRYLMFTMLNYGYFSVWHQESDLWMMDLQKGEALPMNEVNSKRSESFHNWTRNSKWFLFTSRRDDNLYTRIYLASVDEHGKATKPFLLPQKNPLEYYRRSLYSYNTPDFTAKEVEFDAHEAGIAIESDKRVETKLRKR